jgi:hypothetical protein
MNFSALTFENHTVVKGGTRANHTFENGWGISVVSGPAGSGLYGQVDCDTFEVAIFRPNGNLLEDVLYYQTPVQITSICHLLEML